jgi:hypothetical protein
LVLFIIYRIQCGLIGILDLADCQRIRPHKIIGANYRRITDRLPFGCECNSRARKDRLPPSSGTWTPKNITVCIHKGVAAD